MEFERFREWVQATYGDRADLIIREAIGDSFRTGGLAANNEFYQAWVSAGKPARSVTGDEAREATIPFQLQPEQIRRLEPSAQIGLDRADLNRQRNAERTALGLSEKQLTGDDTVEILKQEIASLGLIKDQIALEGRDRGISEFQQATLAQQQSQFLTTEGRLTADRLNEQRKIQLGAQFAAGTQELIRQSIRSREGGATEADLAQIAFDEFERLRGQIADTPRNFFQNQLIRQRRNPFDRFLQDRDVGEELDVAKRDVKRFTEIEKESRQQLNDLFKRELDVGGSVSERELNVAKSEFEASVQNLREARSSLSGAEEEVEGGGLRTIDIGPIREPAFARAGVDEGTIGREIGRETFGIEGVESEPRIEPDLRLNVPEALRPFISGGAARISEADLQSRDLVTPSAQQFNRLDFTAREQFRSAAELKGGDFRDIEESILKSLPERLSLRRTRRAVRQI